MKIGIFDRVVLFVGAFFTAIVGVAIVLAGLQTGGIDLGGAGVFLRVPGWLMVLVGALLFAYGVYILSLPAKYRKKKEDFVVQQTASGELRISVNAIESLVRKVFLEHKEATLSRLDILSHREGIVVDMGVSLADNVSIPLLVGALQKEIKQHLLAAAGVEAKEVRVAVDTAQNQAVDSPYTVPAPSSEVSAIKAEHAEKTAADMPSDEPLREGYHQMPDLPQTVGQSMEAALEAAEPLHQADGLDPFEERGL